MSEELVAFVRARLDEDQAAAEAVFGVNTMAALKRGKPAPRWVPSPEGDAGIWDTNGTPRVKFVWARERDHILRHDPVRVLAEVEAKRKLIERGGPFCTSGCDEPGNEPMDPDTNWTTPLAHHLDCAAYEAAKLMALPHVDHPDYLEAWRP